MRSGINLLLCFVLLLSFDYIPYKWPLNVRIGAAPLIEQQEKVIKYNELVSNAVIFQNVVDMTAILRDLNREGYLFDSEDVRFISPYLTSHIKRFGDYIIDLKQSPQPFEGALDFTG